MISVWLPALKTLFLTVSEFCSSSCSVCVDRAQSRWENSTASSRVWRWFPCRLDIPDGSQDALSSFKRSLSEHPLGRLWGWVWESTLKMSDAFHGSLKDRSLLLCSHCILSRFSLLCHEWRLQDCLQLTLACGWLFCTLVGKKKLFMNT